MRRSLHYGYDCAVVADEGDRLLAFAAAGTPMHSYRGVRSTRGYRSRR